MRLIRPRDAAQGIQILIIVQIESDNYPIVCLAVDSKLIFRIDRNIVKGVPMIAMVMLAYSSVHLSLPGR